MSETSPADLAVAFRSFPRRVREALSSSDGEEVPARAHELAAEVDALVARTASALGTDAAHLADTIEHRPAAAWSDAELDAVRHAASEGGRLIRAIEDAAAAR